MKERNVLESRNREWIHKPIINGVPVSWAGEYLRKRLVSFRKEHIEFDLFLNEIGKLLDNKYKNLLRFINGESEGNWISPKKSMFDVFIKLFNLCLSPTQAVRYIDECYQTYLKMLRHHYYLSNDYSVSLKRCNYDGKVRKFIEVYVNGPDGEYFYIVNFSSLVIFNSYFHDMDIVLVGKNEKYEDALSLFEYHQDNRRSVLINVRNSLLYELKEKGIIKEINKLDCLGSIGVNYLVKDEVGLYVM
jgi:hypothetical protein